MMKKDSKYYSLYTYLHQIDQEHITLTLSEIEALLGASLPSSARRQKAWWSNRSKGALQASAWMDAGYQVSDVSLETEQITFSKPTLVYNVDRSGNTVMWSGELIKGLRQHMGMTQGELADELGVRQQTISEWETGNYAPSRATSKYLAIVAERAEFNYTIDRETNNQGSEPSEI
jgi:DNA-binding transcriptional regulator YiaG